jgi:hypothetical protein
MVDTQLPDRLRAVCARGHDGDREARERTGEVFQGDGFEEFETIPRGTSDDDVTRLGERHDYLLNLRLRQRHGVSNTGQGVGG